MNLKSRRGEGFSLIELMIAIAIIGILMAIALPNYNDYIRKGKLVEATSTLLQYRTYMEQYYQDMRGYGLAAQTDCGVAITDTRIVNMNLSYFDVACSVDNVAGLPQTYLMTMTGKDDLSCYVYRLNQQNKREFSRDSGTTFTVSWPTNPAKC
ncbi:MAG TPA: prepilin-type N-terminal cleavage/methylation domain-containing protein [Rhodocyclaceae bacterium]|nr:prepilin-type N-terminal cleavage/methylation domain-containing protein [Rhodocyclaceae bacterium]